ncbi:MAG: hypothetical protein ABS48_00515 [Erythrobacter sp. SCN 68-10]|nr:MAG: hypothetical protein ABS48_00515 [Erythrobacter sp. SCN 68-10]
MRKQARPRVGRRAGFEATKRVVVQPRSALLIPAVLLVAVLLAVAVLLFLLVLLIPAFLILPVAVLLALLALLAALLVLLTGLALRVLVVLITHVGFLSIDPFGLFRSLPSERTTGPTPAMFRRTRPSGTSSRASAAAGRTRG